MNLNRESEAKIEFLRFARFRFGRVLTRAGKVTNYLST